MEMPPFLLVFDPYLIWFYRMSGHAFVDFLIGTFVVALVAIVIGEFTISLAFLAGRNYIHRITAETRRYESLSVDALVAGDKAAFHAANKLANDAFGKSFFMQIALSAAFLWPVLFALAWMSYRFGEVEFPFLLPGFTVGYGCLFVALYAGAYLIFKRVKCRLPYFRKIGSILAGTGSGRDH